MTLRKLFKEYAESVFNDYPDLEYEWKENDFEDLVIKKKNQNGYDISFQIGNKEIIVLTEYGAHFHFDDLKNDEEIVQYSFGLVRDLLSPNMRIKEYLSNGKPYKWEVQHCINDKWATEEVTAVLFWNYFGKKSNNYYINEHLEPRDLTLEDDDDKY